MFQSTSGSPLLVDPLQAETKLWVEVIILRVSGKLGKPGLWDLRSQVLAGSGFSVEELNVQVNEDDIMFVCFSSDRTPP